jgi:hypothetical protein
LIYLVIMVVVAAVGIGRLWLQQRRQQARLFSVAEFRNGLDKIAAPSAAQPAVADRRPPSPRRRPTHPAQPMDPARRAAAKRRLEERRAGRVAPR